MYSELRPMVGLGGTTPCVDIGTAICDVQDNGIAKSTIEEDGKRCLLGALFASGTGSIAVSTLISIVRVLPPKPGDEQIITSLDQYGCVSSDAISRIIDRIAAFNDDPHTTAEDVIMVLKEVQQRLLTSSQDDA